MHTGTLKRIKRPKCNTPCNIQGAKCISRWNVFLYSQPEKKEKEEKEKQQKEKKQHGEVLAYFPLITNIFLANKGNNTTNKKGKVNKFISNKYPITLKGITEIYRHR